MAIEQEDFILLKQIRATLLEARPDVPRKGSCAILGDCHIHVGLETFKYQMQFDSVETFDIVGHPTHKVNLNELLDKSFYDKYDWIIDSGTLYCCFDVSTVFENITNMLKNKGVVVHTGNLSGFYGRGFYSISPALFRDFYNCNNFTIETTATKTRQTRTWKYFNYEDTYLANRDLSFQRVAGEFVPEIPNDSMIFCCATRKERSPFKKPVPEHFINTDGK